MTWQNARNQLIHILENDVPSLRTDGGLPPKLKHDELATEDAPGQWRTFSLLSTGGGTRADDPAGARRRFRDVDIVVFYAVNSNPSLMDEIIGLDYEAISDALLNTVNWDRPTSTIISLSAGGEEILPFTADFTTETGDRVLKISFSLEHQ